MKSNATLAEDFVTGLILGDIESHSIDHVVGEGRPGFSAESLNKYLNQLHDAISNFMENQEEDRVDKLALEVLDGAVYFRLNGILKNNPNRTKHLLEEVAFYKDRFKIYEQDRAEWEAQMAGANQTIKKLQSELSAKGAIR